MPIHIKIQDLPEELYCLGHKESETLFTFMAHKDINNNKCVCLWSSKEDVEYWVRYRSKNDIYFLAKRDNIIMAILSSVEVQYILFNPLKTIPNFNNDEYSISKDNFQNIIDLFDLHLMWNFFQNTFDRARPQNDIIDSLKQRAFIYYDNLADNFKKIELKIADLIKSKQEIFLSSYAYNSINENLIINNDMQSSISNFVGKISKKPTAYESFKFAICSMNLYVELAKLQDMKTDLRYLEACIHILKTLQEEDEVLIEKILFLNQNANLDFEILRKGRFTIISEFKKSSLIDSWWANHEKVFDKFDLPPEYLENTRSIFNRCEIMSPIQFFSQIRINLHVFLNIEYLIQDTATISHQHTVRISRQRQAIPKNIQREVWKRDRGMCVDCSSKENLEFDHVIPISKGGSNTARNIQILCENCNRKKSNKDPGNY